MTRDISPIGQHSRDAQSGGVIVFLAVIMIPLIALIALTIDGYSLMVSRLEQENNAEFAAIAALNKTLDPGTNLITSNGEIDRKQRAEVVAGSNSYVGNRAVQPVKANEIVSNTAGRMDSGYYDKGLRKFFAAGKCLPGGRLVLNSVRLSLNTVEGSAERESSKIVPFFSRALGYSSFALRSTVIAYRDADRAITAIAPQDSSVTLHDPYDLNSDGVVNSLDYQLLAAFLSTPDIQLNLSSAPANGRECFDVDKNGEINLTDLSKLQGHLQISQI